MDVMALRRMLMTMGGNAMIGEFSQYKSYTATPTTETYLDLDHDFGVPRLIIIHYDKSESDLTNYISTGVFLVDDDGLGIGAMCKYTGNSPVYSYRLWPPDTSLGNKGCALCSSTHLKIRQYDSSVYFKANQAYTVEFYK